MRHRSLKRAYIDYANAVLSRLQPFKSEFDCGRPLSVLPNRKVKLRTTVDELEGGSEFNLLVKETQEAFSQSFHAPVTKFWFRAVQNVLRRSGSYFAFAEDRASELLRSLDNYCSAFVQKEKTIHYLAPIEFIAFASESIDFEQFEIVRFRKDQIDSLVGNSVNEIFYPWAVVDSSEVSKYWFLSVQETDLTPQIGPMSFDLSEITRVENRYTSFPKALEPFVQVLVLFDWQADYWRVGRDEESENEDRERGWQGFNLPMAIRIHDNLYEPPSQCPSFASLQKEPDFDSNGNEIGERPEIRIRLDQAETESFRLFVTRNHSLLSRLHSESHPWHFFEIALGRLIKAFFADDLDQLLWHITTIEALVGEKGNQITDKLAHRLSSILGTSESDKKSIRKRFKDLYSFRSDLVHGNRFKKGVYWGHLREARDFARSSVSWFLNLLVFILDNVPENQSVIKQYTDRKVILSLVDMNEQQRAQALSLIDTLPQGFPCVEAWAT